MNKPSQIEHVEGFYKFPPNYIYHVNGSDVKVSSIRLGTFDSSMAYFTRCCKVEKIV